MAREDYEAQVALLVRLLPYVAKERAFALKGGTAINLFYRDLPRLSVDIDLTYLPIKDRRESLAEINEAMDRIAVAIEGSIRSRLDEKARTFLLSLHDGTLDFDAIERPRAADLPAVRWKLINLEKLKNDNPAKHAEQRSVLEGLFS